MNAFRYSMVAAVLSVALTAFAADLPSLDVTVSNSAGKLVYKGKTSGNGTFSTPVLDAGQYVIQFNSRGIKPGNYSLVTSAGKKKMVAEAVPAQKFAAGGVAMRLDVDKGLNITGQVTTGKPGTLAATSGNVKVKMINGKRYIWVAATTGSNMGGRWVEEGSPEAQNVIHLNQEGVRNLQERGSSGLTGQ